MNNDFKYLEPFFGSWYLGELIGEGSFGKVYKIKRDIFGQEQVSALKIIQIPQSEAEVEQAYREGMDDKSVTTYFESLVKDIISEINLMSALKGNTNVVSYEDHQIVKKNDGIGWIILIRMELLTSLNSCISKNKLTKNDVIELGIDICKALELCKKENIIHRDIKPDNIFVSKNGDYKLGDFGIARQLEKTTSGLSKKGTYTYMAPEVYLGKAYNSTVDIYSLGMVLYRLLNNNRSPFMPLYPAPITFSDRESAQTRQMSGEKLPIPQNADGRLAEVILKACAYNPAERYENPTQMRDALISVIGSGEPYPAAEANHEDIIADEKVPEAIENSMDSEKTESAFGSFKKPDVDNEKTESAFVTSTGVIANAEEVANVSGSTAEFAENEKTVSVFETKGKLAPDNDKTVSVFNTNNEFISAEKQESAFQGKVKVGDIVEFGNYVQKNSNSNIKEKIKWRVLAVEDKRALLITQKCLDCKQYNNKDKKVTWETSTLRKWLNEDFVNTAFSDDEESNILYIEINDEIFTEFHTYDRIFVLSTDEVIKYLSNKSDIQAMATDYAENMGAYFDKDSGSSYWWLRSHGYDQTKACFIELNGSIDYHGYNVVSMSVGVRPALWINLQS